MTGNQIRYQEMLTNRASQQEDMRHNKVTEKETNRHNVVGERETNRHNVVTEGISRDTLAENKRHNVVTEGINRDALTETARHNVVTELHSKYNTAANVLQANTAAKRQIVDAEVARDNAFSNKINAYANAKNALTNEITAQYKGAEVGAKYLTAIGEIVPL